MEAQAVIITVWRVQYKLDGKWYESYFALPSNLGRDEVKRIVSEGHTPECSDFRVHYAYSNRLITVKMAKRIPAKYVQKEEE